MTGQEVMRPRLWPWCGGDGIWSHCRGGLARTLGEKDGWRDESGWPGTCPQAYAN